MSYLSTSNLFNVVWKKRTVVLAVMLASLAFGLFFENLKGEHWNSTYTLVVSPWGEKNSSDFNYDHYYSFEAIDTLTDTLEEWLKSPSTKNQIRVETKAVFRSSNWRFFEDSNFSVRKKAPQLIEISYSTGTKKEADNVKEALEKRVEGFLSSYDKMNSPHFNLTNSTSDVEFGFPNWNLITILSLLWGLILGTILVLLLSNLEKETKRNT